MLLAKPKLNSIEVKISMFWIDSNNCHEEFILTNSVLKELK